jgi:hypothetical protein
VANVYWGDGLTATGTGNWNTAANWYSSLGFICCGCPVAGAPLGRVPNVATDTVILAGFVHGTNNITTGPAGGWSGTINWLQAGQLGPINIAAGTYSGTVTIHIPARTGVPAGIGIIGGTFAGLVQLQAGSSTTNYASISGGMFTGTVTRTQLTAPFNLITGGTYSPTANVTLNAGDQVVPTNIPADPGFAEGGGTFAPVLNVTGNVYPPIADVLAGVTYGPTGANFTGTYAPPSATAGPTPWPFNQEAA